MLEEKNTTALLAEWRIRSAILGRFHLVYQAADREQAEERLEAWKRMIEHHNLPGYDKLVEFTYLWKEEILAYFDFERKYTAAFTEASNGILKARYIVGRGYNFDFLRVWAIARFPCCHKPASAKRKVKRKKW